MSKKPTHKAYVVNQGRDRKSYWREVGAIWPHPNGNGFDINIYDGLAVSGRIVCVEPRTETIEPEPKPKEEISDKHTRQTLKTRRARYVRPQISGGGSRRQGRALRCPCLFSSSNKTQETKMGMDVYGKKPSSEAGKYFRNNIWWWHPLASYIVKRGPPEVTRKCRYWHSNDHDGLNAKDALKLAQWLRQELADGSCEAYADSLDEEAFSVENVREFAVFLEACGGFEIW